MARKRVAGRFVPEGDVPLAGEAAGQVVPEAAGALVGAPRPRYCRPFVRNRMAEGMPGLVVVLLKQAHGGSLGHLKVLVQLAGLDKGEVSPPVKRRQKSLEQVLMEQWAKDEELAATEAARLAESVQPTSGGETA